MRSKPLHVSEPSLAPLENYINELSDTWQTGILTHNGPKVQLLENKIGSLLNIMTPSLVVNGTVALEICLKILRKKNPNKNKVITTAFSWAATATCIYESGLIPIYCDIDMNTFNIDTNDIIKNINDDVLAILPVHVFGNPCKVEEIHDISTENNIPVVYDAAHCFGSKYKGTSVLNYGTFSAVSTHATKIFNTGEGGFIACNDEKLKSEVHKYRFFGYNENKIIEGQGTNGKMNEINASLGLSNLLVWENNFMHRKMIYLNYHDKFIDNKNISLQEVNFDHINFSYFPCVLNSENTLVKILNRLNKINIFPRRYFYPDLPSQFSKNKHCKISSYISNRIICLPLHCNVTINDCNNIIDEVLDVANS